jgi:hypothetical protein
MDTKTEWRELNRERYNNYHNAYYRLMKENKEWYEHLKEIKRKNSKDNYYRHRIIKEKKPKATLLKPTNETIKKVVNKIIVSF